MTETTALVVKIKCGRQTDIMDGLIDFVLGNKKGNVKTEKSVFWRPQITGPDKEVKEG